MNVRTFWFFHGESLFRSQIQRVQELGVAVVLIYSNPPDNDFVAVKNDYLRYDTARNLSSVPRGSVLFLSTCLQHSDTPHMKMQNEPQSQRQLERDVNNWSYRCGFKSCVFELPPPRSRTPTTQASIWRLEHISYCFRHYMHYRWWLWNPFKLTFS